MDMLVLHDVSAWTDILLFAGVFINIYNYVWSEMYGP